MRTLFLLAILTLPLGILHAEEIRLRDGSMVQGDVLKDQSDDKTLAVRVYATGGVIRIPWKDVAGETVERLRGVYDKEVTVAGHRLLLANGNTVVGRVENPGEAEGPVVLKTPTGRREYPRSAVASIEAEEVPVHAVFTAGEYAAIVIAERAPATPAAHLEVADLLFRAGAYREAAKQYELALAGGVPGEADRIRRKLKEIAIFLKAEGAMERLTGVKKLRFRKRFDEALVEVEALRKELADSPAILRLLDLDRIERGIRVARGDHYRREVRRKFHDALDRAVKEKAADKSVSLRDALAWCRDGKGLAAGVFAAIAEDEPFDAAAARRIFASRRMKRVRRYRYGGGAFLHPELKAAAAEAPTRRPAPRSPEDWWRTADERDRRGLLAAWFAEFGGVLEVVRCEERPCPNCAGKGLVHYSTGAAVCPTCNLAGHDRIVVVR